MYRELIFLFAVAFLSQTYAQMRLCDDDRSTPEIDDDCDDDAMGAYFSPWGRYRGGYRGYGYGYRMGPRYGYGMGRRYGYGMVPRYGYGFNRGYGLRYRTVPRFGSRLLGYGNGNGYGYGNLLGVGRNYGYGARNFRRYSLGVPSAYSGYSRSYYGGRRYRRRKRTY